MGKASLYHYFKNKEDIFREVVIKEENILNTKVKQAISKEKKPKDKIKAFVLTRTTILSKLFNIYNALKDKKLDYLPFIKKERDINFKNGLIFIKDILNEGMKENIFYIKDISKTSVAIITALKGFDIQLLKRNELEESLDILLNLFFEGILKKRHI